jgi:hypothetical protein
MTDMVRARDATAGTVAPVPDRTDSPLGTGPFHAALRMAIRRRGLTLDRLRCHLARRGVSVALSTLSDWQHGHRRPYGANSLRAVRALEEILELPHESLLRLVLAPATGPTLRRLRPADGLDEGSGAISTLLDSLPGGRERRVDVVHREDTVYVDADRRAWLVTSRSVVRARHDGVDRQVLRYFGDEGCEIDRVRVRPRTNCRLGAVRRHVDPPVLVAELLFDHRLRAGETWVFGHAVVDRTGACCVEYAHGFAEPQEQYLLEVRFHPGVRPARCYAYAQPGLHDERRATGDLILNEHHAVHLLVRDVTAGLVGVAWDWEPPAGA